MINDIEDATLQPNQMAADVFKMIESCMASLSQKVKRRMLSDEVTRQRELERLTQVEAIREQATMLHGSRLDGDRPSKESVKKTMRKLVDEYMAAVDQDKEDGLDPDTARLWKEQVQEIVAQAKLDQPAVSVGRSKPGPVSHSEATDALDPLKTAIEQARYTTFAVARELMDPDDTTLRGFGKQLGSSKKEIMALSKDLAVDQPADVAMEATRLAGEACDAIKACRESIRATLRELGTASDISEASGPTRARLQQQEKPAMRRLDPEWVAGPQPATSMWSQRPPPPGVGSRSPDGGLYVVPAPPPPKDGRRECRTKVATDAHAGRFSMAPRGSSAETQNEGGGRRIVNPHAGHDERPGKHQQVAYLQWKICGIPPVLQGVVGVQANVPRACARRASVP
jgi:hypothetical protein